MYARDFEGLFKDVMKQVCLLPSDILFVENIAAWCKEQGIPEHDEQRPLKLVSKNGSGCRMLIREDIPEEAVDERINALWVRSQLKNNVFDRADLLNSENKKLAYLLLNEYATSLPEINDDELAADEWVFGQMDRMGFFRT